MTRVAVVTPYYKEPLEKLRRCHDSVLTQAHHGVRHVLVADGQPRLECDGWQAEHLRLPHLGDIGNTPRLVGAAVAAALGFEAIVLLDADNWLDPGHVEKLLKLAAHAEAAVVTATRWLHALDGRELGICIESNGDGFADPNGVLILRPAFELLTHWGFGAPEVAPVLDRHVWKQICRSAHARAHCAEPTVHYETTIAGHYRNAGVPPPPEAKLNVLDDGVWRRMTVADYERLQRARQAAPPGV